MMDMYNKAAIVCEPAGTLSISALNLYRDQIKGKRVVCVVSGGNNDIARNEEIKERSLLYEGLKHYFIVNFPQRAGALRGFVNEVLGPNDDITFFEYKKKIHRENGPAVIGIELRDPSDFESLVERMSSFGIEYDYLNDKRNLFELII